MTFFSELLKEVPSRLDPAIDPLDWWRLVSAELVRDQSTIDYAILAGCRAPAASHVFAAGYQCALNYIQPGIAGNETCSFAVTEAGGGHPREIKTQITKCETGWTITGTKTFVTMGTRASRAIVAVRSGEKEDGRPDLRMVVVDFRLPGVQRTEIQDLPFLGNLGHAIVELADVRISESDVLPGDGYARYIKPFRTIEDLHVVAAAAGYALSVCCRTAADQNSISMMLAILANIRAFVGIDLTDWGAHLALDDVLRRFTSLSGELATQFEQLSPVERDGWLRDGAALQVASRARKQRAESAWQSFLGWRARHLD